MRKTFLVAAFLCAGTVGPASALDCAELLAKTMPLPKLYQQLADLYPAKGEYETTAAWKARVERVAAPTTAATAVPLEAGAGTYDADNATYSFTQDDLLGASRNAADMSYSGASAYGLRHTIILKRQRLIGQNAFGASARMESVTSADYFLMYRATYSPNPQFALTIHGTPAEIKALRPHLQLVLGGDLKDPPTEKTSHYWQATFDSPVEDAGPSFYVNTEGACVGIRESKTGKLLASAPLR